MKKRSGKLISRMFGVELMSVGRFLVVQTPVLRTGVSLHLKLWCGRKPVPACRVGRNLSALLYLMNRSVNRSL